MFKASSPWALALLLIGLAGWVDAIGYLQFGHLFVSFMSGNSTQMAVGLGQGSWIASAQIALVIAVFVFGSFAGAMMAFIAGKRRLPGVLVLEASLLVFAVLLPGTTGAFSMAAVPIAGAMGLQNAALHHVGQRTVGLTYVTGMLVRCGQELANAVTGHGERWAWSGDLCMWLAMVAGAVTGTIIFAWLGLWAVIIPAGVALALAVIGTRVTWIGCVPD